MSNFDVYFTIMVATAILLGIGSLIVRMVVFRLVYGKGLTKPFKKFIESRVLEKEAKNGKNGGLQASK